MLKQVGLKLDDIGWIELNEAFAAQSLAVIQDVGLDPKIVNPLGGAIALGHPLGATGCGLVTKALHELERSNRQKAIITMCCGGGLATGTLIERM